MCLRIINKKSEIFEKTSPENNVGFKVFLSKRRSDNASGIFPKFRDVDRESYELDKEYIAENVPVFNGDNSDSYLSGFHICKNIAQLPHAEKRIIESMIKMKDNEFIFAEVEYDEIIAEGIDLIRAAEVVVANKMKIIRIISYDEILKNIS